MLEFLKKRREQLREEIREEVREELREELRLQELPPEEDPLPEKPAAGEDLTAELYSGMLVEVLTLDNHLIFVGTLEVLDRGILQIRDETGQDVPQVEYNLKVKLRAFRQSEWITALFGFVCGSSPEFWRVDRLEVVQTQEKRDFFRQNIRIEAQVRAMQDSRTRPCRVLDVSAGGVLIRCQEEFREGQLVRLSGVRLLEEEEIFNFTCRVQRIIPDGSYTNYGCQFEQMTTKDEDRLMRVILVLQRKALQARRGGDLA